MAKLPHGFPWPPGSWQALLYEGFVQARKRQARKARLAAEMATKVRWSREECASAALQLRAWTRSGALGLSACAFAAAQRAARRLGFPSWDAAGLAGCTPDVLSEAIEDLESD